MTVSVAKSADELVAIGERIRNDGGCVVYLLPNQEWMAVQEQWPFVRIRPIPIGVGNDSIRS